MIMNVLPLDLLDEILFKMEPQSLAMMRCTNKYFQSYLSNPKFEKFIFWARPSFFSFFDITVFGSYHIFSQPLYYSCDFMSIVTKSRKNFMQCYIFGSCSGLILLYIGGLFVVNPIIKRFRLLDHSGSKLIPTMVDGYGNCQETERAMCVGFAVNRTRTTMRFKIVCILETQSVYRFEISDGDSWRLSETTITTRSISNLTRGMKPVNLDDTLHWLRDDGSIIAFNPETERARLILSRYHPEPDMKVFFAANEKTNRLNLILGTKETIAVYTLLEDSKWALVKQIKNVLMDEREITNWVVGAYDGKCLVGNEWKNNNMYVGVVHVCDMEANSWRDSRSTSCHYHTHRITPSLFFVEENEQQNVVVACNDQRIPTLTGIMEVTDSTK